MQSQWSFGGNYTGENMQASNVIELYGALDSRGIEIWIDGGWAVDALLGAQTRPHGDLDIAIRGHDVPALCSYLNSRGFREVERSEKGWNFVMVDEGGRKVDVHAFVFDEHGHVVDGIEYPDGSLTGSGTISGRYVRCIAPEHLLAFRARYQPQDKDRHDVAKICDKFGLENPWTAH